MTNEDYIEIRFGGQIYWISEPKPDINLRDMTAGFELYLRRIGAGSYAPQHIWAPTGGQAIAKATERITGIGYE